MPVQARQTGEEIIMAGIISTLLHNPWVIGILGIALIMTAFGGAVATVWIERKFLGDIQSRIGPNRVGGRLGLLQLIADAIKLFTKEDIIPKNADKALFVIAPMVMLASAFLMVAAIPFGAIAWGGTIYPIVVSQMDISLIYIEAVSALSIIGIFMAAWGSNNKYSVIAAFRNVARMISYEIPLGVCVIGIAVMANSLNIVEVVQAQGFILGIFPKWFIFIQPIGFIVFVIALVADLGRIPFDQNEAEEELIAGWATEYSGMRWGLAFFSEYVHMVLGSMLVTMLYLGGWNIPGFLIGIPLMGNLLPLGVFFFKVILVILLIIWIRGALPRLRIDQVTEFGWKVLFPLSILNLVWAAAVGLML